MSILTITSRETVLFDCIARLEAERNALQAELAKLKTEGLADYNDMRRFQGKFIDADQKLATIKAGYAPMTQDRAEELAHRRCRRYLMIDTVAPYQFDAVTLMDLVGDVEQALRGVK